MKRSIFRVTAAALAVLAPVSTTFVAPAVAGTPVAEIQGTAAKIVAKDDQVFDGSYVNLTTNKQKVTDRNGEAIENTAWAKKIKRFRSYTATMPDGKQITPFDNAHIYIVESPSMDNRAIPVAVIQPQKSTERQNRPTQYLLNGADGGEGSANWIAQTDVIEFYGGNPYADLYKKTSSKEDADEATVSNGIGANIVIPMAGAFSYYSDWANPEPKLGGKQMWETFITQELPKAIEPELNANGKRGIAGLSMSGTTTLNYAQHHPGLYDTIGSFSGCAATTTGIAPTFINVTLERAGTSMNTMWGGQNSETARYNDALLNAEKLRGQDNIYVSNGSGWAGPYDLPSAKRVNGNLSASGTVIIEGGVIEAATNGCTHELRAKTDALGIPVTYNFRPQGTHQWGYWQEDMRSYWPVMTKGLGTDATHPMPTNDVNQINAAAGIPGSAQLAGSLNPA